MKTYDLGASILLGLFFTLAALGGNEALKDKPCDRVLITQEKTAEGVIETRTCKD